eukprot:gene7638-9097_t
MWSLNFDGNSHYIELPQLNSIRAISIWLYHDSVQAHEEIATAVASDFGLWESTGTEGENLWESLYIDAVQVPLEWSSMPEDQWTHFHLETATPIDDALVLMCTKTGVNCFHGSIAEYYLWNNTVSLEHLQIVATGWNHSPFKSGLVAWYSLEEGQGRSLYDILQEKPKSYVEGADWILQFPASLGPAGYLGWAVAAGDDGHIYYTYDYGFMWLEYSHPFYTNDLLGLHYLTPWEGWVVGTMGLLLHTVGAHDNWEVLNTSTLEDLNDVYFTDSRYGWVVGTNYTVLHTYDYGVTWHKQQSCIDVPNGDLRAVLFLDGSSNREGFIVGDYGTVCKTSSAGNKWEQELLPRDVSIATTQMYGISRNQKGREIYISVEWTETQKGFDIYSSGERTALIGSWGDVAWN